ncbi:hypothetical protein BDZ85DRAFT_55692 [Elsinoe ampelina]|uniref:MYND-type domain-containing protein n=1 Tax=Elsinoe ampelina TaxID=302913 RepID=A0A6A6GMN9_9PEZI|nr:hypothetical protein BDZ85DRAFT_55692 [Elsinoe ampelina]
MFTAALVGTAGHLVCPQPAVDLLRDCPLVGRSSTSFLLLQAGDLRDVLYTIHNQSGDSVYEDHNYQFVVSEQDPIRLARAIFIVTLIIDNDLACSAARLWGIQHHLFLDAEDIDLVKRHAHRLVEATVSDSSWSASAYAKVVEFINEVSLETVRKIWESYYQEIDISAEKNFLKIIRKTHAALKKDDSPFKGSRNAGVHCFLAETAFNQCKLHFWKTGTSVNHTVKPNAEQGGFSNPLFLCQTTLPDLPPLPATLDYLSSFHFADAVDDALSVLEQVRVMTASAQAEYAAWCTSLASKCHAGRITILASAGEPIALAYALQLQLDKPPAALKALVNYQFPNKPSISVNNEVTKVVGKGFDVISAGFLMDDVGILALLPALSPLVGHSPSSILYTESHLLDSTNFTDYLDVVLRAELPAVAMLSGLCPASALTGFTTEHSMWDGMVRDKSVSTSRIRLAWRHLREYSACGSELPQRQLQVQPEDLAEFVAKWYHAIFFLDQEEKAAARKEYTKPYYKSHLLSNRLAHRSVHYSHSIVIGLLCMIRSQVVTDWNEFYRTFLVVLGEDNFRQTMQAHMLELETLVNLIGVDTIFDPDRQGPEPSLSSSSGDRTLAKEVRSLDLSGAASKEEIANDINNHVSPPTFLVVRSTDLTAFLNQPQARQSLFFFVTADRTTHTFTAVRRSKDKIFIAVPSQLLRSGKVKVALLTTTATFRELTDDSVKPSLKSMYTGELVDGVSKDSSLALMDHHPSGTWGTDGPQTPEMFKSTEGPGTEQPAIAMDGSTVSVRFDGRGIQDVCVTIRAGSIVADPATLGQGPAPVYERLSPYLLRISYSGLSTIAHFPYPLGKLDCSATKDESGSLMVRVKGCPVLVYDSKTFTKRPFPVICSGSDVLGLSLGSVNVALAPRVNVLSVRDKALMYLSSMASVTGSAVGASPVPMPDFMFHGGLFLEALICRTHFNSNATGQDSWLCFQLAHVDTKDPVCGKWSLLGQRGVRARCDGLIVVTAVKHDLHGGMVFADGYLITLAPNDNMTSRFGKVQQNCSEESLSAFTMSDTQLDFCKHLMPAAVERCRRSWKHQSSCEYAKPNATIPLSTRNGVSPVCSCGMGKDIDELPTVIAEHLGQYATRVALPLFYQPPYKSGLARGVMETSMTDHGKKAYEGTGERASGNDPNKKSCSYCGTTRKGSAMKACFDCDSVIYCNNACKAKDIKHHKKKCGEERPWVKYLPSEEQKAKLPIERNEEIRKLQPLRRYGWI